MEFPFPCSPEENIVRAIQESHWDKVKGRYSSGLFKGPDTSIGRLAVSPVPKLLRRFFKHLDKPSNSITGAAEINVGELQKICLANKPPVSVSVIADGVPFEAHGEIREKLPRGLAIKIANEHINELETSRLQAFWYRLSAKFI